MPKIISIFSIILVFIFFWSEPLKLQNLLLTTARFQNEFVDQTHTLNFKNHQDINLTKINPQLIEQPGSRNIFSRKLLPMSEEPDDAAFPYNSQFTIDLSRQGGGVIGPTHQVFSGDLRVEWIQQYSPNLVYSNDYAFDIAIDNSGNYYVAGSSQNGMNGPDYVIIKYNAGGTKLWTAIYDGEITRDDVLTAIGVDNAGNVYVTGYSVGTKSSYDYATLKYNSSGVKQWVARYNGPGNATDYPKALAIDATGNIYVTGYSRGIDSYDDYATVKYNSNGVQQWVARYNGTGNGYDYAEAITTDAAGNVYVTGYSPGSTTSDDYTTIKYNANGAQQWVARYNGTGNGTDRAQALTIDATNSVYVTGYSRGTDSSDDYATVKYNTSGVQQWAVRYNGTGNSTDHAAMLVLDAARNVYVTGYSRGTDSGEDYATVKYNTSGVQQWVSRYNGPGNSSDLAQALTIDASNNLYVTGYSRGTASNEDYATIKYNTSGVQQWVVRYNGTANGIDYAAALKIDASNNVYVTGYSQNTNSGYDYATIKYNNNGTQQSTVIYNGTGIPRHMSNSIVLDSNKNVYITGYSEATGSGIDYLTIKYNASGVQQWVARYDGPANGADYAQALIVDAAGNVYVTGYSLGTDSGHDCATIKYNSNGIQLWVARYNGSANSTDYSRALTIDASGNVYVTGYSKETSSGYDYVTIKYNASGVQQWVSKYNGTANGSDYALAMANDNAGNVYVTGSSQSTSSSYDYTTIKYNSNGTQQWVSQYNGTGNSADHAEAIVIDAARNVYVTGYSQGTDSGDDYVTIKYNANGVQQWVSRYNGPGNNIDRAQELTIDSGGNVYVTGYSYGVNTDRDYATIKYNQNGVEQWVKRFDGVANQDDYGVSLKSDNAGNIYVTGYSRNVNNDNDFVTIKYNTNGVEQWQTQYNGLGDTQDVSSALAIDQQGNIFLTGGSYQATFDIDWRIITTIRYTENSAPSIIHTPPSSPSVGQNILIESTVTDDYGVQEVKLYYREGGSKLFTSSTMSKSDNQYQATIPAEIVTSTGIEYYIEAIDISALKTIAPDPGPYYALPISITNLPQSTTQPNGSEQSAYHLISMPLDLDNKTPSAVLEDDLGKYDPNKWRIFELRADQKYYEFSSISAIEPGKGYWLIVKESGIILDTGAGKSIVTNKKYPIALNPGWTFIGNPFNFILPREKLSLRSGSSVDIRNYDKSWLSETNFIQPFVGYAVANNNPAVDTLYLDPYLYSVSGNMAKTLDSRNTPEYLWSIKIKAQCQEALDIDNMAAVAEMASSGWDNLDLPEPPVIGQYVSVTFPHPEWKKPLDFYATDIRPESVTGETWEFIINSNIQDRVTLTFELNDVPLDDEVWLMDETAQIPRNLRENETYFITVSDEEHPRHLKLAVGNQNFIEDLVARFQMIPKTYELSQNFPNPFNPTTTIFYGLPIESRVTLRIFNLLGEEIVTLLEYEVQKAGYHIATWDGRDYNNQSVANGIYLYQLAVDNHIINKKMVLMK